jgi:hypothetical protein
LPDPELDAIIDKDMREDEIMRSQKEIYDMSDDTLCAKAYEAAHHKLTQLNPELELLVDELIVRLQMYRGRCFRNKCEIN